MGDAEASELVVPAGRMLPARKVEDKRDVRLASDGNGGKLACKACVRNEDAAG